MTKRDRTEVVIVVTVCMALMVGAMLALHNRTTQQLDALHESLSRRLGDVQTSLTRQIDELISENDARRDVGSGVEEAATSSRESRRDCKARTAEVLWW